MNPKLTNMERRAVAGMESISREIAMRHAVELSAHQQDFRAMLVEIAANHTMPADCFSNGWGIDVSEWEIVRTDPFEEDDDGVTEVIA
jgi:hypothetical protein